MANQPGPASAPEKQLQQFTEFSSKNKVWEYFLRDKDGRSAKCKTCFAILKNRGTTTCLHTHLRTKHQIELENEAKTVVKETGTSLRQPKITTKFANSDSMTKVVARMIAKDGFPFSVFCTSQDLRRALSAMNFEPKETLPTAPNSIRNLVIKYAQQERDKKKNEIMNLQKTGTKFGITFDEWTSNRNRRYMNLTLLNGSTEFLNLGLLAIRESLTSNRIITMVENKLKMYHLSLKEDIVCMTTDGTSVMARIGKLVPTLQQLCLAHGIQLAVTDVLYPKRKVTNTTLEEENETEADLNQESHITEFDTEQDTDSNELEAENLTSSFLVDFNDPEEELEISHQHYGLLIEKTRKVVRMYRRSPLKNETLQTYVKADFSSELNLILDSKTRWNSLFDMLERFCKLKNCIMKSQIDLKSDSSLVMEVWEFNGLQNLVDALGPLKVTVEAICRRDANLLTADAALNFVLSKLENENSPISLELNAALRRRILERRTEHSSVLQYLHTGLLHDESLDESFMKTSKARISELLKNLIQRLNQNWEGENEDVRDIEADSSANSAQPAKKSKTDWQDELNRALGDVAHKAHKSRTLDTERSLLSTIKREMNMFEAGGTRGLHLDLAYKYLQVIPPTSVESERVFSSAGYFCSKIRSRLNDDTLNELSFLRSLFQGENTRKK